MMEIRFADDDEGDRIAELLKAGGLHIDGLDWSELHPYWLVALDRNAVIVGAVQLILGKPIGWLELLTIDGALGPMARGRVVKELLERGMALLYEFGSSAIMGSIPEKLDSYMNIVQSRGFTGQGNGRLFAKRLTNGYSPDGLHIQGAEGQ